MKKPITLLCLLIASFFTTQTYAQNISNVHFYQDGQNLVISYDFEGTSESNLADIVLFVSTDGGANFKGPLTKVSGDVGFKVSAGNGKQIRWDVLSEMPGFSGDIVFDVRAKLVKGAAKPSTATNKTKPEKTPKPKIEKDNKFLLTYTGSTISPLGITIGKMGGFGFYTSLRFNPDFIGGSEYETDGVDASPQYAITDYDGGYYEYTGESYSGFFNVSGGVMFQVGRVVHLYTGIRYTQHSAFYEIEEYTYGNSTPENTSSVLDNAQSNSAVDAELGLLLNFNKFVIGLGASTPVEPDYFSAIFTIGLAL